MRLLDYLTGLISLLALPFIAWWGVNQSPHSAARLEAQLEARAQQALVMAGLDWAKVDMDGQTAILSGAAPSEDAVEEAAHVVLRSSGQGGLLFGGVSQVQTKVHGAAPVRPYIWRAEKTAKGQIVLSGHVPSKAILVELMQAAEAVSNGPPVNDMVVTAGVPAGNWQGIARYAVTQVAALDSGTAVLSDHVLTLRGDEADDAERTRLAAAAGAVAAPFRGVAVLRGVPLWSATRTEDVLVLAGSVPGEAERRALMTMARRSFGGEVQDEMVVADTTAGGWIQGAKAGLAHLSAFRSGNMTFDPAVGGFIFDGQAPASTLQFLSEDMTRAAGRWRFVIAAAPELEDTALVSAAMTEPEDASAGTCAGDINSMVETGRVGFEPGRADFRREDAPALDELAAIARRCAGGAELELAVGGDALAEARASAFADFLERAGVPRPRLAAIASGPAAGVEGMDTDAVVPAREPLEFKVRERSAR